MAGSGSMPVMDLRAKVLPALIFVTALCWAQTEATLQLILPSGKVLRVLSVSQMTLPDHTKALLLKYQTDLKISDLRPLRKEIDEIWPVFQGDVEKARLSAAIIAATEVPHGVKLQSTAAHYFLFSKMDGEWRFMRDAEGK
jgi:hypothetical protein